MKLSKVLLGSAIALSLVFGFASCSDEDDDDDYEIITGSGNNYIVSHTNDSSDNRRGYRTTVNNHRGALIQLTFNKDSLDTNGALAFIWDLESNSGRAVKDPRVFNIAGGRVVKEGNSYKFQPYVSVYKNISDIQEVNLGATKAAEAEEDVILALSTNNNFDVTPDATTGAVTVTINAYEETVTVGKDTTYTGNYLVDFYSGAIDKKGLESATKAFGTQKITYVKMGYKAYDKTATDKTNMLDSDSRLPEKSEAVYANVYAGKTLNGSFKFIEDYSDADVVEE